LIAVVLFVVGIERIINGLFLEGKHRFTNVGLGIAVVTLSVIAMAFPIATGIFLLVFGSSASV
jgi:TM2 domain-containing membrane protein YozV